MGTDPRHARNTKRCSPEAPDQGNAVTCLMSREGRTCIQALF